MRNSETSRKVFIEYNVVREGILSSQVMNTPANAVFLITYKYCLITFGTSFASHLIRDCNITVAPPDPKM